MDHRHNPRRYLLQRPVHHVDVPASGLDRIRVGGFWPHNVAVFPPEGSEIRRESGTPSLYPELFQRHPANPILTARDWPYPAHTVFNAGACQVGEETVLLVRVEDRRGHSHLTVARSYDGISNWRVDHNPSFVPDPSNRPEEAWGVEDPRLTWVEDREEWVIAYAGAQTNPDGTLGRGGMVLYRVGDFALAYVGTFLAPAGTTALTIIQGQGDLLRLEAASGQVVTFNLQSQQYQ